jgi:hypothetical protein
MSNSLTLFNQYQASGILAPNNLRDKEMVNTRGIWAGYLPSRVRAGRESRARHQASVMTKNQFLDEVHDGRAQTGEP